MTTKERKSFDATIARSNDAIKAAVDGLTRSERGRTALADFKALMRNGGDGLDGRNFEALEILLAEAARGRRDFIDGLPDRTIEVEVRGGCVEVTGCPSGIKVKVIDHDNLKAEGADR